MKQSDTEKNDSAINSFAFYSNFLACARLLKPKDRLKFYESIVEYAIEGKKPSLEGNLLLLFTGIKPTLDASRRKAKNIQKRWNFEQNQDLCKNTDGNTNPITSGGFRIVTDKSSLKDKDKDIGGEGGGGENKAPPSSSYDEDYIAPREVPPPVTLAELVAYGSGLGVDVKEVEKFFDYWAGMDWKANKAGLVMTRAAVLHQMHKWRGKKKAFAELDAKAGGYQLRPEVLAEDTRPDIHAVPTALRPATSAKEMYGGEDPNAGLEE